ncbi:MAG: DNA repair exonuclease [Oscillospiraceae bacterium]|nr:DNA repair exonuclease [Oscillospiraceae bacterium]
MGLKLLHSADWHLDSPFAGFPENQRQRLKKEQKALPGRIADLCRRENCDLVLLAGDLFDGEASGETVENLKKELERMAVPVLISPGNHDFCAPGSPWLEETWPENVYIFTGALESVSVLGLDCRVYGAAFRSMDCPPLLEDFQAEGGERYCIALLHGDPLQKNSPYNPISNAQVRNSNLDYLALGHVHKAGAFRSGNTLCAWPGCPMGRGWDETGDKGVCIVTLDQETSIRAVSLDTLRFFDLEVDVDAGAAQALAEALPPTPTEDFYRITLTGCAQVDLDALEEQFRQFPNLHLRDNTQPPLELWEGLEEDTLEGIYFRMLRNAMEADPENRETIRLAAEISRKLLAGREVTL